MVLTSKDDIGNSNNIPTKLELSSLSVSEKKQEDRNNTINLMNYSSLIVPDNEDKFLL